MAPMSHTALEPIREVTSDEAYRAFDAAAQYFLKMSGREFLDAWKAGAFAEIDVPGVLEVASLSPEPLLQQ